MTTDLAEFRLVRALRAGQPGAIPTLWNAQAGAIFSVIRAMTTTDADAVGWATTFRVELLEVADALVPGEPVAAQVGVALYRHLKDGFPRTSALPEPPIPPTEEGARRVPEAARLLYLVTLFFDAPVEVLERIAGEDARKTIDSVHRLLEPTDDTDARLYVHAALMRAAPVEVLLLPPGVAPEPPRPKWRLLKLGVGALVLAIAVPWLLTWLERPRVEDLAARHAAAMEDATLRGTDPVALGIELTRQGVPSFLAEVPDLVAAELVLLGVTIVPGAEPSVVITYAGGGALWSLQHLAVEPDLDGEVVGERIVGGESLQGRRAGDTIVVAWPEGGTTWVFSGSGPVDAVLDRAAQVRTTRAPTAVPFFGGEAPQAPTPR